MERIQEVDKSLAEVHASVNTTGKAGWRKLLAFFGPAYLVSVGYMDPGNWATDIAGGSGFGYSLLWVLLMSNLMALLLQTLSARLGIVRQLDLAQACRSEYRPGVNTALWVLAEIAIASTDLAEVLGMAIGLQLLFDLPLLWGVSLTVLDTLLILILQGYGMRKMEAFIIALVMIIGGAFAIEMALAKPDMGSLMQGFVPALANNEALYIAIGIIGATVMPHNLYLHSALVQSRQIEEGKAGIRSALKYNFIDSAIALNAAFFVNAAILILAASTFFQAGLHEVREIQDAHQLLEPLLGTRWAALLFGIALVAAGQSSTVTGTLAGQIVMEGYLRLRIAPWVRRLATRLLAIVPAYIVIWIYGEGQTGSLLILSQVILSMQLGFAIIPLVHFTSDREKMGEFANPIWVRVLVWGIAFIVIALNVRLMMEEISVWYALPGVYGTIARIVVPPVCIGVGGLLLYIIAKPWIDRRERERKAEIPHGTATALPDMAPQAYRRIAVAIDFSSIDTLTIGSALSQGGPSAHYLLIHVVESAGARLYGNLIADRESNIDKEALAQYARQLAARGYQVDVQIAYGSAQRHIPRLVREFHADLLVMGAHGHRLLKDILFGSTVDVVRHKVHIPVLIVRDKA